MDGFHDTAIFPYVASRAGGCLRSTADPLNDNFDQGCEKQYPTDTTTCEASYPTITVPADGKCTADLLKTVEKSKFSCVYVVM